MPTWESTLNNPALLSTYPAELAKDTASKGSFKADYDSLCLANNIVPCPFIQQSADALACRVSNCVVDLPSWRAMLLAASTVNSAIVEIAMHSCTLTPQHLLDLAAAMDKMGTLQVLKLDYLSFADVPEGAGPASLLKPFIWGGTSAPVDYLSIKGNCLGDAFCTDPAIYQSLSGNFSLQALSLADNGITDVGACEILRAVRLSAGLKELSLSKNAITFSGELAAGLSSLFSGSAATAEDEATWKNAAKVIADRNKAVKDKNKVRKKSGYAELADTPTPPERISKGSDGLNYISNRALASIDLSHCPLAPADGVFAECVMAIRAAPKAPGMTLSLRLMLKGIDLKGVVGEVETEAEGVTLMC